MDHKLTITIPFRSKETVTFHGMVYFGRLYEKFRARVLSLQQRRGVRHLHKRVQNIVKILKTYPQKVFKQLKMTVVGAQPQKNMSQYRLYRRVAFGNSTEKQFNPHFQPLHFLDVQLGCFLNSVFHVYARFFFHHLPRDYKMNVWNSLFDKKSGPSRTRKSFGAFAARFRSSNLK